MARITRRRPCSWCERESEYRLTDNDGHVEYACVRHGHEYAWPGVTIVPIRCEHEATEHEHSAPVIERGIV
ncbi:MAG: hypothetical protein JRI80_00460 [Deltaproteobacteria bacterium]|nr:hypothetical protein [Deltaproteobacteria bacterium]